MSERLPYEEQLPQQLRDFPLPDEDAAWADMKRRLEEDDDDGIIIWWKRGCAGWGLLLLGLIALGWWVLRELRDKGGKEEKGTIVNTVPVGMGAKADTVNYASQERVNADSQYKKEIDTILYQPVDSTDEQTIFKKNKYSSENISRAAVNRPLHKNKKQRKPGKTETTLNNPDTSLANPEPPVQSTMPVNPPKISGVSGNDSVIQQRAITFLTGDSVIRSDKDSLKTINKADTAVSTKKKDSLKSKKVFFSAGLALYQQIPVAGQTAVPYSSQGRQFSWTDYIPSVYARLNKKDKWFIQGEFRYGAPQYTKPLLYSVKPDTGSINRRDTSRRLQKTYYHQLPVSFNYYVAPNWSVGTGLIWNKFRKSLYEEAIRDPASVPDSFLSKEIFTTTQPEAEGLSKSYFQGLIETQYQWRKFTFGARYAFGLSPFIKFTLPGEAEKKERNQSLQVFLRYEFFGPKR